MRSRDWFCAVYRIFFAVLFSSLFIPTAMGQTGDDLIPQYQPSVSEGQRAKFDQTLERARAGDSPAQLQLSQMYRYGAGADKDEKEADRWLHKSAESGDVEAEIELGATLEGKSDYESAFIWLMKAAQAGSAKAQEEVAALYREGKGVAMDYAQAMQWNLKAAAQHNAGAMCDIGYMYGSGKGVPQDYENAMKWYRMAADAGEVMANENIGKLYMGGKGVPKDLKEAARWFSVPAARRFPDSEIDLAIIYLQGPPELKNPEKAVPLLESAAEQGKPFASTLLAKLYLSGEVASLKKDSARAMRLLEPAAEKGDVLPQLLMGAAEQEAKHYKAAESWYRKAAEQNEGRAVFALAELYSRGQGVARNASEAAKLYVRAYDLLPNATYANNAGWFFATCEDLKFRDRELALKYGLRGVELSEGKNAGFLDTLAEAYFFNEQYDHAVSMEERALELEPQREEFRKSRARFRAALDAAEAKALKPVASE